MDRSRLPARGLQLQSVPAEGLRGDLHRVALILDRCGMLSQVMSFLVMMLLWLEISPRPRSIVFLILVVRDLGLAVHLDSMFRKEVPETKEDQLIHASALRYIAERRTFDHISDRSQCEAGCCTQFEGCSCRVLSDM